MDHTEDGTGVGSERISFTHETSSRGSKEDVAVAVSQRILRPTGASLSGGVLRPPTNDFPRLPSSIWIGSIPIVSHQIETRKLLCNRSRVGACPPPSNVAAEELAMTNSLESATLWGGVGGGEALIVSLRY
jgi:hypothetical protein